MSCVRRLSILLTMIASLAVAAGAQPNTSQGDQFTGGLLREPKPPESCQRLTGQPINMLVLGDSIIWGQGIKEDQKISFQVQDWLCTQTHRPVKLWREAHSGAVLEDGDPPATGECPAKKPSVVETACGVNGKECGGEVNVDDPTIHAQLDHALKYLNGADVDLVLMDGCINDFGVVRYLLDSNYTTPCVQQRAKAVCHDRMKRFLEYAAPRLPNARFIVTGYYPVITAKSAKNVLLRLILGAFIAKGKRKWLFPNAKRNLYQDLTRISREFGQYSNESLQSSVDEVNTTSGGRISFVPVYVPPGGHFGTDGSGFAAPKPTSLLWTSRFNSTGLGGFAKFFNVVFRLGFHALRPNDQVYATRKLMCKDAEARGFTKLSCSVAAFGHPNTKGVNEYVCSVTTELHRLLTVGWLARRED
jgi:hypothetical protein